MKTIKEDEWLLFKEGKSKPKTRVIEVWSKCSNCKLGEIKWYPQWRHYCFIDNNIYSDRCLLSMAELISRLNYDHALKRDVKDEIKEQEVKT